MGHSRQSALLGLNLQIIRGGDVVGRLDQSGLAGVSFVCIGVHGFVGEKTACVGVHGFWVRVGAGLRERILLSILSRFLQRWFVMLLLVLRSCSFWWGRPVS